MLRPFANENQTLPRFCKHLWSLSAAPVPCWSLWSQQAALCPSQQGTTEACANTHPSGSPARHGSGGLTETLAPSPKTPSFSFLWKLGQEHGDAPESPLPKLAFSISPTRGGHEATPHGHPAGHTAGWDPPSPAGEHRGGSIPGALRPGARSRTPRSLPRRAQPAGSGVRSPGGGGLPVPARPSPSRSAVRRRRGLRARG